MTQPIEHASPSMVADEHQLAPPLSFMRTIWALEHSLWSWSKRQLQRHGITERQRLVLRVLGLHPDASAGAISHALRMHPSSLTGVLRRLELKGFITRRTDLRDERLNRFKLTASGEELDRGGFETTEDAVESVLRQVSSDEIEGVKKVLVALESALVNGIR